MSVSHIKTIVIAALILMNIVFGAVIIYDAVTDAISERQAIENACALARAGGISIQPEAIKTSNAIRTMRAVRVEEVEASIAKAVLGETIMTVHGVISQYDNAQRGTAEFYSAGDFEIRLLDNAITIENGTMRTVQSVLRDMGLETASQTVSPGQGGEIVTVIGAYKGVSIFNCAIEFVFNAGSLRTIGGRYITGVEPAEDGEKIMQVGTALLDLLAWVKRGEGECAQVYSIEAGYQYRVTGSSGEGALTPAWLLETDTGGYIINDVTGEIVSTQSRPTA